MYVRVRWRVQAESLTRAFVHRLLCAGLLRSRSPGPLGRATVVEEQLLLYSSVVPREGVPVLGCFNGDLPARHDARRLPKVRAHSASTHRTRLPTHRVHGLTFTHCSSTWLHTQFSQVFTSVNTSLSGCLHSVLTPLLATVHMCVNTTFDVCSHLALPFSVQ